MAHLFVSYSKRDIDFARRLRSSLQDSGFVVWMDEAKLVPSERWWPTIEQNIVSCSALIVIMSPNSRRSRWVEREILVAERDDVDKPIFPVLLAGEGWSRLADLQYEDMTRGLVLRSKFLEELRRVAPPSGQPPPPQLPGNSISASTVPLARIGGRSTPLMLGVFALLILVGVLIALNLANGANRIPTATLEITVLATSAAVLPTPTSEPTLLPTDLPSPTLAPTLQSAISLPTLTLSPIPATATNTLTPSPVPPTATNTPIPTATGPTPLPPNFPTPVRISPLRVGEQRFERGRMYWRQGFSYIWVLWYTTAGSGSWGAYADTYQASEPWSDPSIVAPAGRFQPERGFGKLWRESPNLRDQLGWAITVENYYNADYEYHAGGSVDASGAYTRGQGYYVLALRGGETIRLNDNYTWERID